MSKVERFQARLPHAVYRHLKVAAQKHETSMNSLLYTMILYCQNSQDFNNIHLEKAFPRSKRHGFYTYHPGNDDPISEHGHRL